MSDKPPRHGIRAEVAMNLFVRSLVLLVLGSVASHAQSNALHRGKTFATTAIFGANDTVGGRPFVTPAAVFTRRSLIPPSPTKHDLF